MGSKSQTVEIFQLVPAVKRVKALVDRKHRHEPTRCRGSDPNLENENARLVSKEKGVDPLW